MKCWQLIGPIVWSVPVKIHSVTSEKMGNNSTEVRQDLIPHIPFIDFALWCAKKLMSLIKLKFFGRYVIFRATVLRLPAVSFFGFRCYENK